MAAVRAAWPKDLPRGVIHADLFPDNALFSDAALTGVIDFYFACTDFLAYDLAVCLNAWCFENEREFSLPRAQAMIAAYESVRSLTIAERAALPTLARGAALRFFATRLADWSATPKGATVTPKDPMEYASKLAFHRGARRAWAYGAPRRRSVLEAAVLAPLGGALVAALPFAWPQSDDAALEVVAAPVRVALAFFYAVIVVAPLAWLLGLPWYFGARRLHWKRRNTYVFSGLGLGVLAGTIAAALFSTETEPHLAIYCGVVGAFTAYFAWLIRRPDRDSPNPPTSSP